MVAYPIVALAFLPAALGRVGGGQVRCAPSLRQEWQSLLVELILTSVRLHYWKLTCRIVNVGSETVL